MSVRRLAEDSIQPDRFAFNRENAAWAKAQLTKYPEGREASAVIPLLMRAQEQEGWVTKRAIEAIADMLAMPYIRALEVATFYTQFQLKPVGSRAHVQVCGTTPCMLRGSEELISLCRKRIHPEPFKTNDAGTLSWEEVECQGACVNAPMIMIFKDTYEDLTAERLGEIIDEFEAGKGTKVKPGPQNGRHLSAPLGGLTSLTGQAAKTGAADNGKSKHHDAPTAPVNSAGGEEPTQKGKPLPDTPPEADPTIKEPADAEGPVGPAKADEEAGGEPTPAAKPSDGKTPGKNATGKASEVRQKAGGKSADVKAFERPDDLKLISGVGPKIEEKLHALGIRTFAEIAAWTKAERERVDDELNFHGRIERDDWVKQARALAKGGEAEYERVFGKKPR